MKGIVPLYYEMKKAKGGQLTQETLYQGMVKAYTCGNIGPYSNNITKIWNSGEINDEKLKVIKWLCAENNYCIDMSKTLYMPTRPKEVDTIIKSYTKAKVPNFFQYAKDKQKKQVELSNDSPMNRLSDYIPEARLKFIKTVSKFDYRVLMNLDYNFDISPNNNIIETYDYYNKRLTSFTKEEENKAIKNQEMYKYLQMRKKILENSRQDINYVVNSLVAYLYTVRKTSAKKGLWDCFGDVILNNIKNNLKDRGYVCKICGKRFTPSPMAKHSKCCSKDCSRQLEILRKREKRRLGRYR